MNPEHQYFSAGMNPNPHEDDLSILFSGEGRPNGLHSIGPAIHDYYLIHTVLAGQGQFVIRDKSYSCSTGDTFIIFPGELFFYQASKEQPWHYLWVGFTRHGASALMDVLGVSPDQPVIRDSVNPQIKSYYDQLQSCFQSNLQSDLANLAAGGWLRLLLQQLALSQHKLNLPTLDSSIDRVVKQAIQFITLQYTQTISIEHLSSMLGYHRTHLSKLFKQTTGLSPMQYLLKIRMQRAELLLASSMTIDQVATSVGFSDALYFSKKFRKWRGQSPTEYRNTLRLKPKRD